MWITWPNVDSCCPALFPQEPNKERVTFSSERQLGLALVNFQAAQFPSTNAALTLLPTIGRPVRDILCYSFLFVRPPHFFVSLLSVILFLAGRDDYLELV